MPAPELTKTEATTIRRKAERGDYRRSSANAILDEALIAHVGFSVDEQPFVIPMVFGRDGDRLILHGSVASRLLRALDDGVAVCVTVTLIDALVASRSQFHSSMNYRSVVIIGTAQRIRDLDHARRAMACVVDHALPARSADARPPTDAELRQTAVLELAIDTASVKIRTGGPIEDPDDLALPIWGGIVPVTTTFGTPEPDDDVRADVAVPTALVEYRRPRT
jgi:nitroimidazol reductase NimA-like FMN-containing flavoprotein (pyridoxamine 5'-phosphate oxidase superfamily)